MTSALYTLRQFVFETLLPLEKGKVHRLHVEDVLSQGYEAHGFSLEDRRFGTYLTYGILRHWFLLSQMIQGLSKIPLKRMDPAVRLLLRMGLFQLYAMESVPDFAAVSTTMELATRLKLSAKSRGFLNAVLNTFIRQGKPVPDNIEFCFPEWWLKRLKAHYPSETVSLICEAYSQIPILSIRVNTLKTTVETYEKQLEAAGIPYERSEAVPEVLYLTEPPGDPRQLPGYTEGLFLVQDESSARVARVLDPQPGETVLEIGAAPGTKTTHIAALMQNQGRIVAVDSLAQRMEKLLENTQRLGVSIVEPVVADGQTLDCSSLPPDKVLIDAPCSGTGTIGKHPEIQLVLKEKDFKRYAALQAALLEQGFSCLKPGGTLVYSTCSIDWEENQGIIHPFLAEHPGQVHLIEDVLILPDSRQDGFYIAHLRKSLV